MVWRGILQSSARADRDKDNDAWRGVMGAIANWLAAVGRGKASLRRRPGQARISG